MPTMAIPSGASGWSTCQRCTRKWRPSSHSKVVSARGGSTPGGVSDAVMLQRPTKTSRSSMSCRSVSLMPAPLVGNMDVPGRWNSSVSQPGASAALLGDLAVRVVRAPERKLRRQPLLEPVEELVVEPALVAVRRHPPADVHVVRHELLGELGAPPHRIEVATAEVAVRPVDGVGERRAVAELQLVPDEVDEVELLGDGPVGPAPAARPPDQVEAGVDALDVVAQVVTRDGAGLDVVVDQPGRSHDAVGPFLGC